MRFPSIYANTHVGMRYSGDNGWIDFVVIVPKGCEDAEKVDDIMGDFWNDPECEGLCYGDMIEEAFPEAIILFRDDNDDSEEYDKAWEDMLSTIDWFWVNN